jgi:hypothetical protein
MIRDVEASCSLTTRDGASAAIYNAYFRNFSLYIIALMRGRTEAARL